MIPLFNVFMPEKATMEINSVLESGYLSYGEHTKAFELKLQHFIKNPKILTVSDNSVFFALKLLDIKDGDEIIVSPMSCLMTTQPIIYAGATVVWADIDPLTGTLDPKDVVSKITSRTKAIIHYHWAGHPGYIDEINNLAKEFGVTVIEDATEAFGAEYKGEKLGNTNTDIVCYSFTPVRLPNAIDGGGLAFNSEYLFNKALQMRDLGIDRGDFRDDIGEISPKSNITIAANSSLMNNVSGFIGMHQMDYVENLLARQRLNAEIWTEYFRNMQGIELIKFRNHVNPSSWVFTVLSNKRDDYIMEMRNKGFYTSKLHIRNDRYTAFKQNRRILNGVTSFSNQALVLPSGWWFNLLEEMIID